MNAVTEEISFVEEAMEPYFHVNLCCEVIGKPWFILVFCSGHKISAFIYFRFGISLLHNSRSIQ